MLKIMMAAWALLSLLPLQEKPKFRSIDKGTRCGVEKADYQVLRIRKDWQALWKTMMTGVTPEPALPAVDFAKESIVAVFMGSCHTGGYSIEVLAVTIGEEKIVVEIKRTLPSGAATEAFTQPFHVVAIPKAIPAKGGVRKVEFVEDRKGKKETVTTVEVPEE